MTSDGGLRVLVIDDERNIRTTLGVCLEGAGCGVVTVGSGPASMAALGQQPFDLAFVDLRLASESGLDLIPRLLASNAEMAIVIITAYATFETAVEAVKRGAWDYLPKPFTPIQVRRVVDKASERWRLARTVADLQEQLANAIPEVDLRSESPRMHVVLETLARVAASDVSVLFRGETGTGKGVLARTLHLQSRRAGHPLVTVSCPTLAEDLLASELFGHARGAFTGAVKDQPGRVEGAHRGTLFLDEIGEIPPSLQAKLLRFLQDREFERVGENSTRRADVRVIAATNRDIEADIKAGRFREDLLFRLNTVEIALPPLRERREDILPMARRFAGFFARVLARPHPTLSAATEEALIAYAWPGNIRELRNTMERALILWPAQVLEPEAFPERMRAPGPAGPQLGADVTLEDLEREHIMRVLARAPSLDEAAAILGIDASTLWRKRKRYET